MKNRSAVLFALIGLGLAQTARADFVITTALSGANENPVNASPATGLATLTYSTALNQLAVNVTFNNLTAPASAAHIHFGLPGTNGPIVFPFGTFPATSSGTFSTTLTTASAFNPSPANGINTFNDMINAIQAGNAYVNIHNTNFPGGEVRGFTTTVPEPSSVILTATGLAGLLGYARSRRRS